MIIGLGNDLCDIRRIEQTLERFGDRFLERVFTETERKRAFAKGAPAATLAKRFAAKEACAKALGTGFRNGTFWRDMGVTNLPSGRPTIVLSGGAKANLDRLIPEGYEPRIDVTLTDEPPLAAAVVIISATPKA